MPSIWISKNINNVYSLKYLLFKKYFLRNIYFIWCAKIYTCYHIIFSFFYQIFWSLLFHPLLSSPSLFSSYLTSLLNTYQFYLFAYNGNYRLELLYTADKFPYLPSYFCLVFSLPPYNYICWALSKSKFIFKPSTSLSDKSKNLNNFGWFSLCTVLTLFLLVKRL